MENPRADEPIIFGRDLKEGGTWMGYNRATGVFAAITNVRAKGDSPRAPRSRGQLVLALLRGEGALTYDAIRAACLQARKHSVEQQHSGGGGGSSGHAAQQQQQPGGERPAPEAGGSGVAWSQLLSRPDGVLAEAAATLELDAEYAGFNLLVAQLTGGDTEAYFVTNRPPAEATASTAGTAGGHTSSEQAPGTLGGSAADAPAQQSTLAQKVLPFNQAEAVRVRPGVHALSNSTLDDERWGKVKWIREQLAGAAALLPRLAEMRMRYAGQVRNVGEEHAGDMGIPATTHAAEGAAVAPQGVDAHAHGHHGSAAGGTSAQGAHAAAEAEAALAQAVLAAVTPIMYVH
jgi:uncharacterized protein with NRDE domain